MIFQATSIVGSGEWDIHGKLFYWRREWQANFSILPMRTPLTRTVWKGKKRDNEKMSPHVEGTNMPLGKNGGELLMAPVRMK